MGWQGRCRKRWRLDGRPRILVTARQEQAATFLPPLAHATLVAAVAVLIFSVVCGLGPRLEHLTIPSHPLTNCPSWSGVKKRTSPPYCTANGVQKGRHAGPSWQHAAEHLHHVSYVSGPPHPCTAPAATRGVWRKVHVVHPVQSRGRFSDRGDSYSYISTPHLLCCIHVQYASLHRNVDLLRDGDSDWPWRGVREFATPGRNRKREQHVGGDKREGDEEESSPCTGPCETKTSVRRT